MMPHHHQGNNNINNNNYNIENNNNADNGFVTFGLDAYKNAGIIADDIQQQNGGHLNNYNTGTNTDNNNKQNYEPQHSQHQTMSSHQQNNGNCNNGNTFYHRRTAKRVELAKRKARSELQKCGWQSVGYANGPNEIQSEMWATEENIERVNANQMSLEEFVAKYESRGQPVILLGLTDEWKANQHQRWNLPGLLRGYRNQKFKCGEDDEGYSVKMKMKYYLHYLATTPDDSPLYIFDSSFGERPKTAKLLEDYEIPRMFKDDLFRYSTEKRRPPYRWFVMGPARSGTAIHIDPLGTSAWNALVFGHKKWCLIHPNAPKSLVKPQQDEGGAHPDEAITWFNTVYHRVRSNLWPSQEYPVIHALQRPGEVMFVPSGWWHVVMNLDTTIAVTQNFCSIANLPKVWPKTVKGRPQLALHWLKALRRERPELLTLIEAINRQNGIPPLDVTEPLDSSSSSSSSDDSASESDEGEYGNKLNAGNTNANANSINANGHAKNASTATLSREGDATNGLEDQANIDQVIADAQWAAIAQFGQRSQEHKSPAQNGTIPTGREEGNSNCRRKRKCSPANNNAVAACSSKSYPPPSPPSSLPAAYRHHRRKDNTHSHP